MRKVIVIGCPGAGKSRFSKQLHEITHLPLYHIDMIFHNPDKTHITTEELVEKIDSIFKTNEWIIDGNYQRTLETRIKECDTIFLLDYPVEVCIAGAEARVGTKRDDLPWIEEKLDEEFKQVILNFSKEKLPLIYELLEKHKDDKEIIIFKTRDEANEYIEGMKKNFLNNANTQKFDELQFLKENYESPEQWAQETIRAHSFHEPIPEIYLEKLMNCKTWDDVIKLSKEVVPFLKR